MLACAGTVDACLSNTVSGPRASLQQGKCASSPVNLSRQRDCCAGAASSPISGTVVGASSGDPSGPGAVTPPLDSSASPGPKSGTGPSPGTLPGSSASAGPSPCSNPGTSTSPASGMSPTDRVGGQSTAQHAYRGPELPPPERRARISRPTLPSTPHQSSACQALAVDPVLMHFPGKPGPSHLLQQASPDAVMTCLPEDRAAASAAVYPVTNAMHPPQC